MNPLTNKIHRHLGCELTCLVCTPAGARGGADFALALMRKSLRLCSEMSHFCTNLQYYIHFEVMESAWQVGRGGAVGLATPHSGMGGRFDDADETPSLCGWEAH